MKTDKSSRNIIIRLICILSTVAIALSMTSCMPLGLLPGIDISIGGSLDDALDSMFGYEEENEQEQEHEGVVIPNNFGNNNESTDINVEGKEDIKHAAAKGLLSSLIILASSEDGSRGCAGSGVIYKMDKAKGSAIIITNYHVVYDIENRSNGYIFDNINLYLYGSEYENMALEAHYVGGSMYYDIALLYVEGSEVIKNCGARPADFADSDNLRAGQTVMAIGNAANEGVSVSKGVVSVDSEYIDMKGVDNKTMISLRVIRVDAAVNSGNSGGGLFNTEGNLVGIVNAKIIESGIESIGYAIPANVAKAIAENILYYCSDGKNTSVMRPLIGITVQAVSSYAHYNEQTGLVDIYETVGVAEVSDDSIAKGIIREGDVLKSITVNGKTKQITRQFHVIDAMLEARDGQTITITVVRGNAERHLKITITSSCLAKY